MGTRDDFRSLLDSFHNEGISVVLDGVFNHVGRDFWAFRDLKENREHSPYQHWFKGVNFHQNSPYNDGFSYEGWEGHYDLVSLNLQYPEVRHHLLEAVRWMIHDLNIDGLRLDVAYMLDRDFLRELRSFTSRLKPDFWLLGEIIHGDYAELTDASLCHSATNYEMYKGLWSSHNDRNYFEVAWTLNRLFGEEGICRNIPLYNFADNHDVNRVASSLKNPKHLQTLYTLLFTAPGIPSVYYGSEWMERGTKEAGGDPALRNNWDSIDKGQQDLVEQIQHLARLRKNHPALREGKYQQVAVANEHLAFRRITSQEEILIALNARGYNQKISLDIPGLWVNVSDQNETIQEGELTLLPFGWKIFRRVA